MKPIRIAKKMTAEKYRAAKGISKSSLDSFADCPALYKAEQDGLIKRKATPAMSFGTLLHALFLDKEAAYYVKPDGMTYASKEGKEWRDSHADKPVISQEESDELNRAVEALRGHRHAAGLLKSGKAEVSMFGVHKETGLAIRGRADWLAETYIADLKTTGDASSKGMAKSIVSFRYHVQAAMYLMLAQQNGLNVNDFYFIAIQRGEVPLINVRLLAQAAIEAGRMELDRMLRELKACQETGIWPDYSGTTEKPQMIDLPAWFYSDTSGMELTGADISQTENDNHDIIP